MPSSLIELQQSTKHYWQHRQQFQAMASASMIFIAGGMKFAWSIFEEPQVVPSTKLNVQLLAISWFLGALVGVLLTPTFVQKVTKNVAHVSSGALLMAGGILSITFPTLVGSLFVGSMFEGCAFGLTQVQALVTGGEVADRHLRGLLVASERIFLWCGICLQLLYTRVWYSYMLTPSTGHSLHVNQMHGIVVACLGLAAMVLTTLYRRESPLLLPAPVASAPNSEQQPMRQAKHATIMPFDDTTVTTAERSGRARGVRLLPLGKLMLLRGFVALSMSLPFNRVFLTASWGGFECTMNCLHILAMCGLVGSILGGLCVDAHGRRQLAVCSMLLGGIMAFIVGGIFDHVQYAESKLMDHTDLEMAASLLLMFQLVTSLGIGVVSSVYLAEAFDGATKALSIAAVLAWECLVQVGLSWVAFRLPVCSNATLFFSVGVLHLLFGLMAFFFLPETRLLTLRESVLKFR